MTFIDYIFLGLEGEDWTLFIKYPFWKVPQNATVVKHSIIKKNMGAQSIEGKIILGSQQTFLCPTSDEQVNWSRIGIDWPWVLWLC